MVYNCLIMASYKFVKNSKIFRRLIEMKEFITKMKGKKVLSLLLAAGTLLAGCGDSGVSDCITAITPQQVLSAIDTMLLETETPA